MRITSMIDASKANAINAPPIGIQICAFEASPIMMRTMPITVKIPYLIDAEKNPESNTIVLKFFIGFLPH